MQDKSTAGQLKGKYKNQLTAMDIPTQDPTHAQGSGLVIELADAVRNPRRGGELRIRRWPIRRQIDVFRYFANRI